MSFSGCGILSVAQQLKDSVLPESRSSTVPQSIRVEVRSRFDDVVIQVVPFSSREKADEYLDAHALDRHFSHQVE